MAVRVEMDKFSLQDTSILEGSTADHLIVIEQEANKVWNSGLPVMADQTL